MTSPLANRPPAALFAAIIGLHLAGLLLLLAGAAQGTLLFGLGGLAYLLGLRHAFDIDHIAVIDNVTRKLTREQRSAGFVGFAFSAGHSSVVFGLCALVVASSGLIANQLDGMAALGGVIGTVISATFLSIMAARNARLVWQLWQRYAHGQATRHGDHEMSPQGWLGRLIHRGTGWIDRGWKMYPLGFVFGLGFDTATEVALLGLSAGAAQHAGWPPITIMALPLLFAAGMTTLDSVNGWVMWRAYGWGEASRARMGFNLVITAISVAVAFIVASIEWSGLAADRLAPDSAWANLVGQLPTAALGLAVLVGCLAIWLMARRRSRQ